MTKEQFTVFCQGFISLTSNQSALIHGILGVHGISQGFLDDMRAWLENGRPISEDALKVNIGKALEFLDNMCQSLGTTSVHCTVLNKDSLDQGSK